MMDPIHYRNNIKEMEAFSRLAREVEASSKMLCNSNLKSSAKINNSTPSHSQCLPKIKGNKMPS